MAGEKRAIPWWVCDAVPGANRRHVSFLQSQAVIHQQELRLVIKQHCCSAGIQSMMLGYYYAFGLELVRHVGQYGGPGLAERIGRQLVAKWTKFGLKPEMLTELVYRLTNHRLDAETA